MRQIIEVNRPALSKPCSIANGNVAVWTEPYMSPSRVVQTGTADKPVYRLTKDFENNNLKFNLSMLIDSGNVGKAEKFMAKTAKDITEEDFQRYVQSHQAFIYLDKEYK